MKLPSFLAMAATSALVLAGCGPQEGGPNATPFDGSYNGSSWTVRGPAQCGGGPGNPTRLQVTNGVATVLFNSVGVTGPVGPNGELNSLRSTGLQPLQTAYSRGQITGNSADVTYVQDLCTWRFQGTRGGA